MWSHTCGHTHVATHIWPHTLPHLWPHMTTNLQHYTQSTNLDCTPSNTLLTLPTPCMQLPGPLLVCRKSQRHPYTKRRRKQDLDYSPQPICSIAETAARIAKGRQARYQRSTNTICCFYCCHRFVLVRPPSTTATTTLSPKFDCNNQPAGAGWSCLISYFRPPVPRCLHDHFGPTGTALLAYGEPSSLPAW